MKEQLTKYFRLSEFRCRCGCGLTGIDPYLLAKLTLARDKAEVPFIINSALRCKKHNRDVGGVENSAHLTGQAVDIKIVDSWNRFRIVRSLIEVGFKRIKMAKTFIHTDVDDNKTQDWFGL